MDSMDSGYQTSTYEAVPEEPGQKKRATWSLLTSIAIHSVTVASTFLVLTLLRPPPPTGIVEFESVVFSEDNSTQIGDPNSTLDKSDIDVDEVDKEIHEKRPEIQESNVDVKKTMDTAESDVLEETETAVEKSGAGVKVTERATDALLDKTLSQEKARTGALAKEINAREKAAAARMAAAAAKMVQKGARLKKPGKDTDGSELFSKIGNKNLTLVIDVSGSMGAMLPIEGGGSIQALEYVKLELAGLIRRQISSKSRFNILTFSSVTKVWKPKLVRATSKNKKSALAFLKAEKGGGGTQLMDALVTAFADKKAEAILVLTDGQPSTPADVILQEVKRMNKGRNVTIYTVAFIVGAGPREFLRKLAMQNGGIPKAFP
ncbi:MAG: VWA domain-containing protein [Planctomycetota bacterium]|nr:VWA domain-containing protein [Planctomycetota bacterium]